MIDSQSKSFDSIDIELIIPIYEWEDIPWSYPAIYAKRLMKTFNYYLQPWLLINDEIMEMIGTQNINIQLVLKHYNEEEDRTEFYEGLRSYFIEQSDKLRVTRSRFNFTVIL